ncbi:MAG TPA: hypothetical protein PKY53_03195 [Clostridia bacterium]|nr:hypothetical protein [Clostridia bacterium]
MIYILYLYRLNLKDPFLEHEFYANSLKKLGIKHIINTLYTIRTLLNTEENKETANIVMSDYGVNPPFVPR